MSINNIPSKESAFSTENAPINSDFTAMSSAESPDNQDNQDILPIDYQAQAQEVVQLLDYYEKLHVLEAQWEADLQQRREAIKREKEFLSQCEPSTLYINQHRRDDLALDWAFQAYCESGKTNRRRLDWLYQGGWETGILFGERVICFFMVKNNEVLGISVYKLSGVPWIDHNGKKSDCIELDGQGRLVADVPNKLGHVTYSRKAFESEQEFKLRHHGRTRQEMARINQRRREREAEKGDAGSTPK